MCKSGRSALSCWLILALVFLLPTEPVVGEETDPEPTSARGLWESDIFFLQKLASFFGGGKDEGKTAKPKEPIRRNDQDQIFRHETVPPQLFHPERIDGPNGPITIVGHAGRPNALPHLAAQNLQGVRMRPGFPQRQKLKMKIPPSMRKHGEKLPPFPGHPQNNRPFRVRPGGANLIKPDNFRMPPPVGHPVNKLHEPVNFNMHHKFTPPPPLFVGSAQTPFVKPVNLAFTPTPQNTFTRTVTSSFSANKNAANNSPFPSQVSQTLFNSGFSLPRDSSVAVSKPVTPKTKFDDHPNLLQPSGSVREVSRVKQPQFLSGLPFNSVGLPSKERPHPFINNHLRPSPQPQKVNLGSSKDVSSKFDNPFNFGGSENEFKYNGLEKKFKYSGPDNFQPSPKEGNMLDNAFQPIFRASQKLDVDLPASFMKPIHVASARSLTFSQPPPPPEVIDFIEEDGMRSF